MSEYYKGLMYILVEAGIIRKESTPSYSELLMAVKTLAEQKDRPDREKIAKIIFSDGGTFGGWETSWAHRNKDGRSYRMADQIIALFPDKAPEGLLEATIQVRCEEARRDEKERIIEWGLEVCPHWSSEQTREVGVIKRDCGRCWQALKGDPKKKEVKTNKGEANA